MLPRAYTESATPIVRARRDLYGFEVGAYYDASVCLECADLHLIVVGDDGCHLYGSPLSFAPANLAARLLLARARTGK